MPVSKIGVAPAISRRTVIGAGAAAIVSGLGGYRSAAGERREVNWPDRRTLSADDRHLSPVFRRNAYGFYRAALACQVRFPENSLYSLAIAIELSLKAYLLHRGASDDWNRIYIRHDLRKALACTRRAGFRHVPGGLPDLASHLTPCYEGHAFSAKIMIPQPISQACDTVCGLLLGVAGQIDQETAAEDWVGSLRREGAHA